MTAERKRAPPVNMIGARWPISGAILNIDVSIGIRTNSKKSCKMLRLSFLSVAVCVVVSGAMVVGVAAFAGGAAVATAAPTEGAGSAILKPEDNFLVRWESPRISEELYRNFQGLCQINYL